MTAAGARPPGDRRGRSGTVQPATDTPGLDEVTIVSAAAMLTVASQLRDLQLPPGEREVRSIEEDFRDWSAFLRGELERGGQ